MSAITATTSAQALPPGWLDVQNLGAVDVYLDYDGATEFTVAPPAATARARANGIVLPDGTFHPFEDQPPVAVSKGWGERPGGQRMA